MKFLKWATVLFLSSITQAALAFTLDTRVANDYALFDEITSVSLVNKDARVGEVLIKGMISARKCAYDNHAIFLRPHASDDKQIELYDVTVNPIYKNESLEVTYTPCTDIAMSPQTFDTKLAFKIHEWDPSWTHKTFSLSFIGIGGTIVKQVDVTFTPGKGWSL